MFNVAGLFDNETQIGFIEVYGLRVRQYFNKGNEFVGLIIGDDRYLWQDNKIRVWSRGEGQYVLFKKTAHPPFWIASLDETMSHQPPRATHAAGAAAAASTAAASRAWASASSSSSSSSSSAAVAQGERPRLVPYSQEAYLRISGAVGGGDFETTPLPAEVTGYPAFRYTSDFLRELGGEVRAAILGFVAANGPPKAWIWKYSDQRDLFTLKQLMAFLYTLRHVERGDFQNDVEKIKGWAKELVAWLVVALTTKITPSAELGSALGARFAPLQLLCDRQDNHGDFVRGNIFHLLAAAAHLPSQCVLAELMRSRGWDVNLSSVPEGLKRNEDAKRDWDCAEYRWIIHLLWQQDARGDTPFHVAARSNEGAPPRACNERLALLFLYLSDVYPAAKHQGSTFFRAVWEIFTQRKGDNGKTVSELCQAAAGSNLDIYGVWHALVKMMKQMVQRHFPSQGEENTASGYSERVEAVSLHLLEKMMRADRFWKQGVPVFDLHCVPAVNAWRKGDAPILNEDAVLTGIRAAQKEARALKEQEAQAKQRMAEAEARRLAAQKAWDEQQAQMMAQRQRAHVPQAGGRGGIYSSPAAASNTGAGVTGYIAPRPASDASDAGVTQYLPQQPQPRQ